MAAIRVSILGMGFMGDKYARVLRRIEQATLVGVCDSFPTRAIAAGEEFAVPHFQTVDDLLARAKPQLLVVCGPENTHVQPACAALECGIAVLVEKPLATTLEDAQQLCMAARRSGALLSVGHLLRFDQRYVQARNAVASGGIGRLQSIHTRRWNTRSAQDRLRGRCSLPLFLGVHDYDLVRWFAGSEPVRIYAESRSNVLAGQGYPVEDTSIALISFANGVLACVEEGWIMPEGHASGCEQRLDALGDAGMVQVSGSYAGLTMVSDATTRWPDTMLWPPGDDGSIGGALESQVRHVVRCVAEDRPPLVTGEDGLAAVRMALAISDSAATQQPIQLFLRTP